MTTRVRLHVYFNHLFGIVEMFRLQTFAVYACASCLRIIIFFVFFCMV